MKTWFNVLPLAIIPIFLIIVPALVPHMEVLNKTIDGMIYRAFVIDRLLLPLMSAHSSWLFADWFQSVNAGKQIALHCLIVLNLVILAAPVFYGLGTTFIKLHNWTALTEMKHKRHEVKK